MGGMGLRSAETNCSVAYVTSQILTEHMVAGLLGLDEVELFENVTEPREKARVLSVRLPHSGD